MQNRDVPVEQHVRAILDQVDPHLADGLAPERLAALVRAYADPALAVPPTVDDGALGALQALAARGLTLAVISNIMRSPGVTLRKILAHYRLLPYFSVLTFSDECRIRKPDPEIFRLTLRETGIDVKEAVHVGDDPTLDVAGAHAAGMRAIQNHLGLALLRVGPPEPALGQFRLAVRLDPSHLDAQANLAALLDDHAGGRP